MSTAVGGQVHAMFNNPVNALPQVKAQKLRALAVTGARRLPLMPDLPTVAESGYPGFEATTWYGLFGPSGLPREITAKIHEHVVRALKSKDVQDKLDTLINQAVASTDKNERAKLYGQLQNMSYENALDIFVVQPLGREYHQTWVKGWYFNPIIPVTANEGLYFYVLSKEQ